MGHRPNRGVTRGHSPLVWAFRPLLCADACLMPCVAMDVHLEPAGREQSVQRIRAASRLGDEHSSHCLAVHQLAARVPIFLWGNC